MAKKILTPTIATALAERVMQKLNELRDNTSNDLKNKGEKSKDFKEYCKLIAQIDHLEKKKEILQKNFEKDNSKMNFKVSIQKSYPDNVGKVNVYASSRYTLSELKGLILLEDYITGEEKTVDQLVQIIISKLLTTA